jgi:proteic killer suppression protein
MIRSFKHKGLKKLYEKGSQEGINPDHVKRVRTILARLDASTYVQDMNLPGLKLHRLKGVFKEFWSVSVSGNWRIIFRVEDKHAYDVDYINYH